jgi:hypothetical protein
MVAHLGKRGGAAHQYTRQAEDVEIFGNTGIKYNLSVGYAQNEDGSIRRDTDGSPMFDMYGMDKKTALDLRNRFSRDVGTMLMAHNDEAIEVGLNDDNIDMMIPFHKGKVPEDVMKKFDAKDYSDHNEENWSDFAADATSTDKPFFNGKKRINADYKAIKLQDGREFVIYRGQEITKIHHLDDKNTYLEICTKLGIKPKFYDVTLPSTGESVTTHPQYMKMVRDVARNPNDQRSVDPSQINWDKAEEVVHDYIEHGGHPAEIEPNPALLQHLINRIESGEWPTYREGWQSPTAVGPGGQPLVQLEQAHYEPKPKKPSSSGAVRPRKPKKTESGPVSRKRAAEEWKRQVEETRRQLGRPNRGFTWEQASPYSLQSFSDAFVERYYAQGNGDGNGHPERYARQWRVYRGPREGKGWQNIQTGEVRYQERSPDHDPKSEDVPSFRPSREEAAPKKEPSRAQQDGKERGDFRPGWIGVDLDGCLAKEEGWQGVDHIGEPVPAMVERVKRWLSEGKEVRIMTARVAGDDRIANEARRRIQEWCKRHLGVVLPVTNEKDPAMIELWDDRARQVERNTGEVVGSEGYRLSGDEMVERYRAGEMTDAEFHQYAIRESLTVAT